MSPLVALLAGQEQPNRTDARIMDTTCDLLSEHGTDITMDQVAERSGLSRATIFRRFGTKETLIERTIRRELRIGIERTFQSMAGKATAKARAIEFIARAFELAVEHPVLRYLFAHSPSELTQVGVHGMPSMLDMTRQTFTDVLQLAISEAESTPILSPAMAADVLIHTIGGYVLVPTMTLPSDDSHEFRRMIEDLVEQLLIGP